VTGGRETFWPEYGEGTGGEETGSRFANSEKKGASVSRSGGRRLKHTYKVYGEGQGVEVERKMRGTGKTWLAQGWSEM